MRSSFEDIILEDLFLDEQHLYMPGNHGCNFFPVELFDIFSVIVSHEKRTSAMDD